MPEKVTVLRNSGRQVNGHMCKFIDCDTSASAFVRQENTDDGNRWTGQVCRKHLKHLKEESRRINERDA